MSTYSELIKNFGNIREYMRSFYIYGFRSREEYAEGKSLRTYDNEKRRIESYLDEYMSFRTDDTGKIVYISVDTRAIPENPFYRALKAKSFTDNDITLNFMILDILYDDTALSSDDITYKIDEEYMSYFKDPVFYDKATVRIKLKEYTDMGILESFKSGRSLLYRRVRQSKYTRDIIIHACADAVTFFSEVSPLGIIGSYILDKSDHKNDIFVYKHHYIMHALESEIVYDVLSCMHAKGKMLVKSMGRERKETLVPIKILVSEQSGRQYMLAKNIITGKISTLRLDNIDNTEYIGPYEDYEDAREEAMYHLQYTWGVSQKLQRIEHVCMRLRIKENEEYLVDRIEREGRRGVLRHIQDDIYEYENDVYDASEMLPWLRSFIGRIISLESSNKRMTDLFYSDIRSMMAMYGEDDLV